jgi:hypothetical protein
VCDLQHGRDMNSAIVVEDGEFRDTRWRWDSNASLNSGKQVGCVLGASERGLCTSVHRIAVACHDNMTGG